ncbi:MAG: carboxymuconolactone decarboxylase family protein [Thermoplasmatales archaeon]
MSENYEKVKKFADQSLGEMPKVIEYLFKLDENAAMEQFNQNQFLYLGRTNLELKTRVLIAMSVALANGPMESAMIHFKLAKKFKVDPLEIVDAMRVTKMALMSSTLDSVGLLINAFGPSSKTNEEAQEANKILESLVRDSGVIPERILESSEFSTGLMKEHIREKKAMLKPIRLSNKEVYAVAFAVSASIRDRECEKVYLSQFVKNGGTKGEAEDILTTVRFLVGNRAFVNGLEILKNLTY